MARIKPMHSTELPLPASPKQATAMAAVRILVAVVGPFAVAKGWVDTEHVEGVAALAVSAGTALYGLFKTHSRQKRLVASS